MKTLLKKELNYYLNNPVGYIVIVLFAIFVNFFFVKDLFLSSIFSLRPLFFLLPWFNMIFIPALTMRIFSEEKRIGTIEILLTLPVKEREIILSKFFCLLILYLVSLFLTFSLVIFMFAFSKANIIELFVGYFGQILFASLFISVSIYFSNKTKNQIVAFLIGFIINFFLLVFSNDFIASVLPRVFIDNLIIFTPVYHLENFSKGIISLASIFYFVSFTGLFLYLTFLELRKRS